MSETPKVFCVKAQDALRAINRCMDTRVEDLAKKFEYIKRESKIHLSSMKRIKLKAGRYVPIKKLEYFQALEEKMFSLHEDFDPAEEMNAEFHKMLEDTMELFDVNVWDPSHPDNVYQAKCRKINPTVKIIGMYVTLSFIAMVFYSLCNV